MNLKCNTYFLNNYNEDAVDKCRFFKKIFRFTPLNAYDLRVYANTLLKVRNIFQKTKKSLKVERSNKSCWSGTTHKHNIFTKIKEFFK